MLASLYNLPLELLERIISFIDLPKELLPLALTCQLFCNLIIPNHLDYRVIKTHAGSLSLWQSLAANPLLSANVRTLCISGIYRKALQKQQRSTERSLVPHSSLLSSAKATISDFSLSQSAVNREGALSVIADCLCRMCNLTHFTWDLDSRFSDVWTLFPFFLTSFPNVTSITISDISRAQPGTSHTFSSYLPLFSFSNLTEISFTLNHTGPAPYADDLVSMLTHRCPELKKLHLSISPTEANVDLTELIRLGIWSHLKHIMLSGKLMLYSVDLEEAQKSSLMRDFFRRNIALELIYFGTERMTPPGFLPIEGLPRLHSLGIGHRFQDPYVPMSTLLSPDSVRNLRCFYSINPITSSCLSLLAAMPSLRYLSAYFSMGELPKIGDVLSRLERFQIGLDEQVWDYAIWNRFVDCMLNLRNLTHLTGPAIFQGLTSNQIDQLIQRLGTLPRLCYLKFALPFSALPFSESSVKFERDENGAYLGHSLSIDDPAAEERDPFEPYLLR